jgi:3-hydroxyisobutyrate dehydrogenase-like beta-hydroxyacid dehydrogenase
MTPAACASVAILTKIGRMVEAGPLTRRVFKAKTGVRHQRQPSDPFSWIRCSRSKAQRVEKMKIAFIGLGNMGTGIAQCILKSGHDLIVWNRTATKTGPLVALGARAAMTAREAAAAADVVITSLMDDKSVLDVVQARDGMLTGMRPNAIHACVTTISPECADELENLHRGHGSFYVSAPVAGRPDAAASGRLASFLGGAAAAVERFMPACKSYSVSVTVISERPRMANVMKLAINYNVISTIELISQSYIFAEKCGLPLEHLCGFYQEL